MQNAPEWAEVDPPTAKLLADDGKIVVAGTRGQPHGHVAILLPDRDMVYSGKWRMECPVVSNVGRENWIAGANYCFSKKPQYFVLIEDVA